MANGDTRTNQILDIAANGSRADLPTDTCCETRTQSLIRGVAERIMDVEDEVERLENNPDVVDIVATYADLQAYDTSGLTDKDIIRVLEDSTHDNNSTYYRWNATTSQFGFVGEISGGSSVNVVQATGTSTTDVMSQNAVTSMVFADPSTKYNVKIGSEGVGNNGIAIGRQAYGGEGTSGQSAVAIGQSANTYNGSDAVAVGPSARARANSAISIGYNAGHGVSDNQYQGAISLGAYSQANAIGEMNIGSSQTAFGYNSSNYRLLTGLYDPQNDHDAATKGYVDNLVGDIETALNVINNGSGN